MRAPSAVESRNAVPERSTTTFGRPAAMRSLIRSRRYVYDARSISPWGARTSYSFSVSWRISSFISTSPDDGCAALRNATARGDDRPSVRRLVGPHDPHREELRAATVRVAQRLAGAVDLVLTGLTHDLERRLGEAQHPAGPDGVGGQHTAAHVDRELAADGRLAGLGQLPAVTLCGEPEVLDPHRLEPRERNVDLRAVDLLERVGDPGLLPQRGGGVAAGAR